MYRFFSETSKIPTNCEWILPILLAELFCLVVDGCVVLSDQLFVEESDEADVFTDDADEVDEILP